MYIFLFWGGGRARCGTRAHWDHPCSCWLIHGSHVWSPAPPTRDNFILTCTHDPPYRRRWGSAYHHCHHHPLVFCVLASYSWFFPQRLPRCVKIAQDGPRRCKMLPRYPKLVPRWFKVIAIPLSILGLFILKLIQHHFPSLFLYSSLGWSGWLQGQGRTP